MKRVFFLSTVLLCSTATFAQVAVAVKIGTPVYCPPPPPPVVVVRPAPIVVRPVVVVHPAPRPVYVVSRPRRAVVIYR